jgi:hypothetical protein
VGVNCAQECVTPHETLECEAKPRIGPHILPKFRRAPRAHTFSIKFREILSRANPVPASILQGLLAVSGPSTVRPVPICGAWGA